MKKALLLLLGLLAFGAASAQSCNSEKAGEDYDLYISAGAHLGLWWLLLNTTRNSADASVPYNVHIDKVFKKRYALGLGYSYDEYDQNPLNFISTGTHAKRQNVRLRFYKFFYDQERRISPYIGASAGISFWHNEFKSEWNGRGDLRVPTAQFLMGLKIKFTDTFFLQSEAGFGAPYAFQTALGIRF